MDIPYISADDMRSRLNFTGLIEALRTEHLNEPPAMERTLMTQKMPAATDRSYLAWHAWSRDDLLSVASAVKEADIIVTLTSSDKPLVQGDWLNPGTHISLVGSFTPTMREVDDEVMRRGKIFVDTHRFSVEHCGDLVQPIAAGVISAADIQADLFGLCQNKHLGRSNDTEITVFKNAGGAHLDMYAAKVCLACCSESLS